MSTCLDCGLPMSSSLLDRETHCLASARPTEWREHCYRRTLDQLRSQLSATEAKLAKQKAELEIAWSDECDPLVGRVKEPESRATAEAKIHLDYVTEMEAQLTQAQAEIEVLRAVVEAADQMRALFSPDNRRETPAVAAFDAASAKLKETTGG